MKNYKKFFIGTLIILIILVILIPSVLIKWTDFMTGRHHYSQTADYINYLIEQKNAKAQEFDEKYGNKIVFFSGSNTLYGINSKYMHQKSNLPIINYGISMGLEHYIFDEVKKILKSGDIVIMPLEFSLYRKNNLSVSPQLAEYLITYGKDYVQKLSPMQKLRLSFYLIKTIMINGKLEADKLDEDILSRTNDFGDFTANKGTSEKNVQSIYITEAIPAKYDNFALYDFINFCKGNYITLFATAPFFYHQENFSENEKEAFEKIKSFYSKNGIDFIGETDTISVKDKSLLYDGGYHANDKGQKIRSDYFLKLIYKVYD